MELGRCVLIQDLFQTEDSKSSLTLVVAWKEREQSVSCLSSLFFPSFPILSCLPLPSFLLPDIHLPFFSWHSVFPLSFPLFPVAVQWCILDMGTWFTPFPLFSTGKTRFPTMFVLVPFSLSCNNDGMIMFKTLHRRLGLYYYIRCLPVFACN